MQKSAAHRSWYGRCFGERVWIQTRLLSEAPFKNGLVLTSYHASFLGTGRRSSLFPCRKVPPSGPGMAGVLGSVYGSKLGCYQRTIRGEEGGFCALRHADFPISLPGSWQSCRASITYTYRVGPSVDWEATTWPPGGQWSRLITIFLGRCF